MKKDLSKFTGKSNKELKKMLKNEALTKAQRRALRVERVLAIVKRTFKKFEEFTGRKWTPISIDDAIRENYLYPVMWDFFKTQGLSVGKQRPQKAWDYNKKLKAKMNDAFEEAAIKCERKFSLENRVNITGFIAQAPPKNLDVLKQVETSQKPKGRLNK